ncbi:MAG: hypothetical protein H6684_02635 [Deltaproteobacteria bacterium]|nr:hypothetical protein [Deltaproteobacteria bacterium]MCB9478115.1 hypothetical protein [Deltaproteobacteria bacterium]MCB9487611.1 hypothetical protein [Deltaproteobacteria bacterium]
MKSNLFYILLVALAMTLSLGAVAYASGDDDDDDDDTADDDSADDDDAADDDADDDAADDDDDSGPINVSVVNGSGEILPSTKYQFVFTVQNTNTVGDDDDDAKADDDDDDTTAPTGQGAVYGFEVTLPNAGYTPEMNLDNTSAPTDWNLPTISQNGEANPYTIYWEYSGWASSNVGDILPGEAGNFSFNATSDIIGTDGFPWLALTDGPGKAEYTGIAFVGTTGDDDDDDTVDDDDDDDTGIDDDDDDDSGGGCGC